MNERILDIIESHKKAIAKIESDYSALEVASKMMIEALKEGKKILVCGNGGSAADSQHFAAELTGRFQKERKALAAIALTTDTSALTSIANDYSFEQVFSRQIDALGSSGDILVAFSTSGNSKNILLAAATAKAKNMKIVGLTGKGGQLAGLCDICICCDETVTARIQEIHSLCLHIICALIEESF